MQNWQNWKEIAEERTTLFLIDYDFSMRNSFGATECLSP